MSGELVLYRSEDGGTRLVVHFEDETVWLTQAAIADLFQTTPQNIRYTSPRSIRRESSTKGQLVRITYKFARKGRGRFAASSSITTSRLFSRSVTACARRAAHSSANGPPPACTSF